jgi:hypothetical protein
MNRWLLPLGLLLTLGGYFGSWIAHPVAGLAITGLDFGEYVKFLPAVKDGTVLLWRAGFYTPLVAISAAASLAAFRTSFSYTWWARAALLAIAIISALNLVPPAWTPARLLEDEFRLQSTSLLLLLSAVVFAPFLALVPNVWAASCVTLLALVAMVAPIHGYISVLPALTELYGKPLSYGWGIWCMPIGLILVVVAYWMQPEQKDQIGIG